MSIFFDFFKKHSNQEQADSIASYMFGGKLAIAARTPETNIRLFLEGLAVELERVEQELINYTSNYIVDNGTAFIEEWEASVGIPDDCFSQSEDDATRQRQILTKLAMRGAQTQPDFVRIAKVLGFDVNIVAGIDSDQPGTDKELRFTIVVEFTASAEGFPYTFPFIFGSEAEAVLRCIFSKIKPSNCQLIMKAIQAGMAVASDSVVSATGTVT